MAFKRLHPAIQHHVANSLGWRSLRELQERAIDPILDGADTLIVGPTAGGKTEAATLPLLSRMLAAEWSGLSAIYVAPLRALANDIEVRLHELFLLLGRRVAAWHGDIGPAQRKAILREPPDLLITTPESLEVMLISAKVDHRRLFRDLHGVVVDEVHSFGSDDRGWHLLSVLSRIEKVRGRRLQRVGLSATVGNPEELLAWLAMPTLTSPDPRRTVIRSRSHAKQEVDLRTDFVGSLNNAAAVIAQLHRGEKRLVFCDSRSNVERLAARLRDQRVDTYVSHSSLSRDERHQAEKAFAEGSDCVIVATSTLELGIDVGDLDRVIQLDAPSSVASFLQRMGRTGRRAGSRRNMLFLATTPEYLLRSLGLTLLWARNFVEDVRPPADPRHVVSQQLLGLCLQEGRIGSRDWFGWISEAGLADEIAAKTIADWMLDQGFVASDGGMLFIGDAAEKHFGHRHFMELTSVFTTPPLIEVRHGREHLGSVHESSFYVRDNRQPVLLLAGRSWALDEIDWTRRLAFVVPARDAGDSKWIGAGQPLSFALCRAMRDVICGEDSPALLSKRAEAELVGLRDSMTWANREKSALVTEGGRTRWWTFAGTLANLELQWRLGEFAETSSGVDELSIPIVPGASIGDIRRRLSTAPAGELPVAPDAVAGLKFNACLDLSVAEAILRQRARDIPAVHSVTKELGR